MATKEKIKQSKNSERYERTLEVLETIGKLGVVIFMGIAIPNAAGHIMKMLGWVPDYKNRYRTQRIINSLEKQNYVHLWVKNGEGRMELTKEGKRYFANLKLRKIKLQKNINWDSLWRIVTFDIPDTLKSNRKSFSRALNNVGMSCIEKSMYVYPHECKEEILKIAELCEVKKYARYIIAKSIDPDFRLKSCFPFTRSKSK